MSRRIYAHTLFHALRVSQTNGELAGGLDADSVRIWFPCYDFDHHSCAIGFGLIIATLQADPRDLSCAYRICDLLPLMRIGVSVSTRPAWHCCFITENEVGRIPVGASRADAGRNG
jgi:hypothetical protein